jgi:hypothetical protein
MGLYLAPVFREESPLMPPHTTISLPVQTAMWYCRGVGAFAALIDVQVSVAGLYLAPVFKRLGALVELPPHTIISLPVQTAV